VKTVLRRLVALVVLLSFLVLGWAPLADARGARGGGRGRSIGPGTGSNPRSHLVRPHARKDGTFVPGHRRSNPNRRFEDNWTTNPNVNPFTGKRDNQVSPPRPR
jgi:hypothetical protein